ncbi:elongation factor 1-delta isoform X2 [Ornithorhynchus anatinus]|uniref:elongation factor 1-delta isoform X2 n=1 Tax=Ornithorhynchus anatinus TaxID=9258 RepID=UPI0010A7FA40|nr:elongation factor 1-delta isoform X2 [Ornithorhynchus anatinus]
MGSRKPSCLLETVWEDKRKYDEAERRHYEREAAQAAAEASPPPASPNGLSREESGDDGGQDSRRAPVGDRKQKKRKRSPRHKSPGLDFALVGLSADHVWFDKPLFDRAERAYRAMLADVLAGEGPEAGAAEPPPDSGPRPEGQASAPAGTPCAHGNRTACHHVVRGVWLNKFYFDRAERAFVERSQVLAPPRPLDLPALPLPEAHPASGWGTPDEGYITAVPTPAAAGLPPVGEDPPAGGSPSALGWPGPSSPPANGKPRLAGLRALMAEVWLAKPRFDNAERRFYEAMFDGHPPGKVRLQEREGPRDAARRGRKERRNRNATGKRPGPKRAELCGPEEAGSPPPPCRSPREDSEPRWPGEPPLGGPGSRHRAVRTLRTARPARARAAPPSASAPGALLDARDPHSVSAIEPKKMATNFLMQEKIWFDKFKYDEAERKFYEQVNGPVNSSSCPQENGASTILRDIARARENIQKSLAGSAAAGSATGPSGDHNELVSRIASLEVDNQSLRGVIRDLQLAMAKLETRLSTLEKSSPSHRSPAPQTQHVSPMRKVEPPARAPAPKAATPAEDDEDDEIDLFGSDDEEEDKEAARLREERLRQYAEKKSKKPGLIAKSSILLDVKPWDDETDMAKMEECVRSVQLDGLVWGGSKLVPVGYGIKKLQIQCVVEDDKVGTDILEEEITKFEDYVQSVDIAAFNKI